MVDKKLAKYSRNILQVSKKVLLLPLISSLEKQYNSKKCYMAMVQLLKRF